MPLNTSTQTFPVERLTFRSSIAFETAEKRLRSSIQKDPKRSRFHELTQASRPTSRESFEAYIEPELGPHGFMHFTEFNHGSWLPFFEPPTSTLKDAKTGKSKNLRAVRFILGNPLIAITMLRHDLDAGLYVPVEVYLVEEPDGSAKVIWYKPSGLIAGYDGAKEDLVSAARVLDGKLEHFVRWVLDENEGDAHTAQL